MSLLSAGSNLFSWHLLDVFGTSNNVLELLPLSVSVCIAWQHSQNLSRSTCLPGALLKEIFCCYTKLEVMGWEQLNKSKVNYHLPTIRFCFF